MDMRNPNDSLSPWFKALLAALAAAIVVGPALARIVETAASLGQRFVEICTASGLRTVAVTPDMAGSLLAEHCPYCFFDALGAVTVPVVFIGLLTALVRHSVGLQHPALR
ncbi:MAG: DUF2946 family protein [Gammaproteobacteria bacterium]|nr:DUF2946 family protein [Gammaproteobacteria bacterium]